MQWNLNVSCKLNMILKIPVIASRDWHFYASSAVIEVEVCSWQDTVLGYFVLLRQHITQLVRNAIYNVSDILFFYGHNRM